MEATIEAGATMCIESLKWGYGNLSLEIAWSQLLVPVIVVEDQLLRAFAFKETDHSQVAGTQRKTWRGSKNQLEDL